MYCVFRLCQINYYHTIHCSPYRYKEVSVPICKDSQITVLKMVKIVMFLSI